MADQVSGAVLCVDGGIIRPVHCLRTATCWPIRVWLYGPRWDNRHYDASVTAWTLICPYGHVFTQSWPAGPDGGRRDEVICYWHRHDRGRCTLRGIDEQLKKVRTLR